MLTASFIDRPKDVAKEFVRLLASESIRRELRELTGVLDDRRRDQTYEWPNLRASPLRVHGRYRQEEILAALRDDIPRVQGGTYPIDDNLDAVFVTLRKTEQGFSLSTMYRDYAISPTRFHWESPNNWHSETAAAKRYLDAKTEVVLFVRETQHQLNGLAEPYFFLGPARLVEWSGARPLQIVWELGREMPGALFQRASLAAG